MSYDKDIYYSPEKFGLKIFGELDVSSGYDFDKFVIWTNETTDRLYWAFDSGCSCPSPFESFGLADLETGGIQACLRALQTWFADRYEDTRKANMADYVRLLERLIQL